MQERIKELCLDVITENTINSIGQCNGIKCVDCPFSSKIDGSTCWNRGKEGNKIIAKNYISEGILR